MTPADSDSEVRGEIMKKPNVVYISIDAMHPDLVFKADKFGLKIPYLRSLIEKSTHTSRGVYGIYPTLTYPCHVTMFTGVNPATHGLFNNIFFDPDDKHGQAWNWFDPGKGKLGNLWSAAKKDGYATANVCIPCTTGNADIDYNIIEYWRDKTLYNDKLFNCLCSPPWLIEEMEEDLGFIPGLLETEKEDDVQRGNAALWILENKLKDAGKPFFLSHYFASYDGKAHECTTYSKEAFEALEAIDDMCMQIEKKAREVGGDDLVVCIVSDHGMSDVKQTIRINAEFKKAGFIKSDDDKIVKEWTAYCHYAHGMAEARIKDQDDVALYNSVEKLLRKLEAAHGNGIKKVYNRKEIKKLGSFLSSDFALEAELGYRFENSMHGNIVGEESKYFATHGYSPEYDIMRASFFIKGKGIAEGVDCDDVDLVDYAPTVASVMGIELEHSEGKSVL